MLTPPNTFCDKHTADASSIFELSKPESIPSLQKPQLVQGLERQVQGTSLFMQQTRTEALIDKQKKANEQNTKRTSLISHPLPNDVLFGRGRPLQAHQGNLRFHRIVNKFRDKYKNAPKDEKAIVTATVLSEVSTADPPFIYINDDQHKDKKMTSQNDQDKIANNNEGESASTCAAASRSQESSTSSRPYNIDNDDRYKGGRFLKRTESGKHWIEVSMAEAREKASHALRGQPRRSDLRSCRSSSDSTALHVAAPAMGSAAMNSSFASSSCTVCSGSMDKDAVSTTDEKEEKPPSRPKKRKRNSKSENLTTMATATEAASAEAAAAATAAIQTSSVTPQLAGSSIQNPLDALTGARFPATLQGTLAARNYLIPEQTTSSLFQQQKLQHQLVQYLSIQQQQQQQREYQARIQRLRQDVQRQIVVEIMAHQLVQQEQEQFQANQQQTLFTEQEIQRQLLLQQHLQQWQPSSIPTQHHHITPQQLSQQLVPHSSSNSVIASFLRDSIASQQSLQQQQQQQHKQPQNLMLQQLLMGTATPDQQRDHSREEGKDDHVKPPAR